MPNFLTGATDLVTTLFNHAEDIVQSMPASFLPSTENKTSPLRRPVDNPSRRTASNSSPARPTRIQNTPVDKFLEGTWGSEINISDDELPQPTSKNTRSQFRNSRAHGDESEGHRDMSWSQSVAATSKDPFLVSKNTHPAPSPKSRSALQRASARRTRDGEPPNKKSRLELDTSHSNTSQSPTRASSRLLPQKHSPQPSSSRQSRVIELDPHPLPGSAIRDRTTTRAPLRALGRDSLSVSQDSRQVENRKEHQVNVQPSATDSNIRLDVRHEQDGRRYQNRLSRSNANTSHTPPPSKITARYHDESPDVLQGESTVASDTKRRRPLQELTLPSSSTPSDWDYTFNLKTLVCAPTPQTEGWHVSVSIVHQKLAFYLQTPEQVNHTLLFRYIAHVCLPEDNNTNIMALGLSSCPLGTKLYLEFHSEKERRDFVVAVLDNSAFIRQLGKSSDWLREALCLQKMRNEETRIRKDAQSSFTAESEARFMAHSPGQASELTSSVRQRKIDNLDHPHRAPLQEPKATANTQVVQRNNISTLQSSGMMRQTRSSTTDVNHTNQVDHHTTTPRRKDRQWKRSLVYPPNGKRKETVTWDDLAFLEDDTFLNDSLIGLFLRYIQEHCQQENLSKMHFFNSFFFEALTRNVDKKKNQVINYSNVASWTKHINLFTRDFVVVPVNENLHWYIMIICNLRGLAKQKAALDDDAEIDGEVLQEADVRSLEQDDKGILQSDVTDTGTLEIEERTLNQMGTPKFGRRKKLPPRRKYDVNKPIIITLDSFEIPRSQTASVLKHYLIEEAKKHDLELDKEDIQGMTAKGIPKQSNFSDCGLYMCLYMEQFMRDPYAFVRCILQRETNTLQWPKKIESSELRDRYYDMLQEMYRAQKEKRPPQLPQVGDILINMSAKQSEADAGAEHEAKPAQVPQSLSPETVRAGIESYKQYRADVENSLLDEADGLKDEGSQHIQLPSQHRQQQNGSTAEAITIEDNSYERRRTDKSSPYFITQSAKGISASPVKSSYFQADQPNNHQSTPRYDPTFSTRNPRQVRSPAKQPLSQHSIIDLSSPVNERTFPDKASSVSASPSKRNRSEQPQSPSSTDDEVLVLPEIEKFLRSRNDKHNSTGERVRAKGADEDDEEPFNGFDDQPGEQLINALAADVATSPRAQFLSRHYQKRPEREHMRINAPDQGPDQESSVPETNYGGSQDLDGDTEMLLD